MKRRGLRHIISSKAHKIQFRYGLTEGAAGSSRYSPRVRDDIAVAHRAGTKKGRLHETGHVLGNTLSE